MKKLKATAIRVAARELFVDGVNRVLVRDMIARLEDDGLLPKVRTLAEERELDWRICRVLDKCVDFERRSDGKGGFREIVVGGSEPVLRRFPGR